MNSKSSALLLIDIQKGFTDSHWGKRNNPSAEENMDTLLKWFRSNRMPTIHVQHLSTEPSSPLCPGQPGVEFMEGTRPQLGERIFQKTVNSAFIGTDLCTYLKTEGVSTLVLIGFTTDHCVSTGARMAANLGFKVFVVADATVAFERIGMNGKYSPELVHDVSLSSLSGEFAQIVNTDQAIAAMTR